MPWHIDSAPGSHALRSTTHLSASHLSAMQSSASAGKGSARQEPAERPSVTFAGGPCAPLQLSTELRKFKSRGCISTWGQPPNSSNLSLYPPLVRLSSLLRLCVSCYTRAQSQQNFSRLSIQYQVALPASNSKNLHKRAKI